ncbi:2-succinyl-5-enolpyruvyl-6-hydroxy-3-cyclohexene-1-carboxylic-acid synthase [Thermomicrobium sp. 4228-Ro]|uniref:2-succinyl-5-enolpyruvyl-6-hydroxy-3- cyclohexene-1-carboxylic-acid synthase n=1 Tax=Thermomicrobium sp. 4228-Ro TaxID=2993937 RepID=UPI0022495367|nr:2-succinyl-5-enolpyruvyl-6-hydroxy-3-cyclohexene-1-carboxylic-acid synthase [Thermomicrobium sp. 4228-Ro]MCX2728262.1 2-succinyl-5-enolpyruvyl-6-hydroxy-3-cyclohexene-1-carboxylic-acid synthase [Thermomicrobium sp. 4228-Ro]
MEYHEALGVAVTAFVQALASAGIRHACFAPGSRSTPIVLALAREPRIRLWDHLDERAMGYFALGLARALNEPVAVVTTSGTAAANLLPAVVEANLSQVPLVVLTADRPPELRDVGAPQTIDQLRLYGTHVKWFSDVPLPDGTPLVQRAARTSALRAVALARAFPPGPVHLNLPYREPLVPRFSDDPVDAAGMVVLGTVEPDERDLRPLAALLASHRRGVIVAGPQSDPKLGAPLVDLATHLGYPTLADPLSQVRAGPHRRELVLDAYDAVLREPAAVAALRPELVLRVGALPTSKSLQLALEAWADAVHVLLAPGNWPDPSHQARWIVQGQTVPIVQRLLSLIRTEPVQPEPEWAAYWRQLDRIARTSLAAALAQLTEPFEGRVFAELADLLPDGTALIAGNSMPVRDLDSFFPSTDRRIRFFANRGANGIDGVTSTAFGIAAGHAGPTVLVTGDLSFYHDLTGLLAARRHRLRATIVLVNNDGGGIFSFLPQAREVPELFEFLFGTPHGLDFRHASALFGLTHTQPADWPAFRSTLAAALAAHGVTVIELRTDRQHNAELHQRLWEEARAAVRAALREGR